VAFDGEVLVPLDETGLRETVRGLRRDGVASIAICFLHSYVNPAHERRAAEIVREEAPGVAVSLSSEISPVIREYERTSTTVVNAYVMTGARLPRAPGGGAPALGYRGRLFVMQSGASPLSSMARFPAHDRVRRPPALMAAAYGSSPATPTSSPSTWAARPRSSP
jgi:N-methylhydantoinase A